MKNATVSTNSHTHTHTSKIMNLQLLPWYVHTHSPSMKRKLEQVVNNKWQKMKINTTVEMHFHVLLNEKKFFFSSSFEFFVASVLMTSSLYNCLSEQQLNCSNLRFIYHSLIKNGFSKSFLSIKWNFFSFFSFYFFLHLL